MSGIFGGLLQVLGQGGLGIQHFLRYLLFSLIGKPAYRWDLTTLPRIEIILDSSTGEKQHNISNSQIAHLTSIKSDALINANSLRSAVAEVNLRFFWQRVARETIGLLAVICPLSGVLIGIEGRTFGLAFGLISIVLYSMLAWLRTALEN